MKTAGYGKTTFMAKIVLERALYKPSPFSGLVLGKIAHFREKLVEQSMLDPFGLATCNHSQFELKSQFTYTTNISAWLPPPTHQHFSFSFMYLLLLAQGTLKGFRTPEISQKFSSQ